MKEAQDGPVKKWFKPQMGIFTDVSAEIKQIWDLDCLYITYQLLTLHDCYCFE